MAGCRTESFPGPDPPHPSMLGGGPLPPSPRISHSHSQSRWVYRLVEVRGRICHLVKVLKPPKTVKLFDCWFCRDHHPGIPMVLFPGFCLSDPVHLRLPLTASAVALSQAFFYSHRFPRVLDPRPPHSRQPLPSLGLPASAPLSRRSPQPAPPMGWLPCSGGDA